MAWRRPDDKPLSETMMVSLPTHICVTRSQWVNPRLANYEYRQCISNQNTWNLAIFVLHVSVCFFSDKESQVAKIHVMTKSWIGDKPISKSTVTQVSCVTVSLAPNGLIYLICRQWEKGCMTLSIRVPPWTPLYWSWSTLIPTWISNCIHLKVGDEIYLSISKIHLATVRLLKFGNG